MAPVIVYDLDDTLISEKQFAYSGFDAVSEWLERNHRIGGFNSLVKEVYNSGHRGTIFNETLEKMGLTFDESMIEDMVSVYQTHEPKIDLLPEAKGMIDYFGATHPQAIITDGNAVTQRKKIEAINLPECIKLIVVTDELGKENWKPSEVPYRKIMDAFPDHQEFNYIGDNPEKDFLGANRLGWRTFRIYRTGGENADKEHPKREYRAHHILRSLMELKPYFASATAPTPRSPGIAEGFGLFG